MSCFRCREDLGGALWKTAYSIAYDKCRGKTCPDCGKVRRLGWIETIYTENPRFFSPCIKCKRTTNCWTDKICNTCFLERERKRGCVCFFDSGYDKSKGHYTNINYYCPLCDEACPCREALCGKCFERQTGVPKSKPEDIIKEAGLDQVMLTRQTGEVGSQALLKAVLTTAVISLVIGFLLGCLFFKKLRKKGKIIK